MKKEFKTYTIATVQDFLRVPENRLDACLEEFRDWMNDVYEFHRRGGIALVVAAFEWTDDGIPKGRIELSPCPEKDSGVTPCNGDSKQTTATPATGGESV